MNSEILMILIIISITPFLLLLLFRKQEKRRAQSWRLPPGPKQLPLIGNLHQVGDSPHKTLPQLANVYGPLMFLQLGCFPTVVISSADVAREIFKSHDLIFSGRPELYAVKKLNLGCDNISFAPYSEYWRETRKIAIKELLTPKSIQSFRADRDEEVEIMMGSISRSSGPVNLRSLTLVLANNVVCRAIFGKKFENGEGIAGFDDLMHKVQHLLGKSSVADFFPWLKWVNNFNDIHASMDKYFAELHKLLDEEIKQHLDPKRTRPEDLVDVLLRTQKDSNPVIALSNEQIKAVLNDIFIAATDSSSATLVWTMTELIRNPSVLKKAQTEIRKAINGKQKVEEEDLSKLLYLKSVLKESLRLHPPAPLVPRETINDCTVRGYTIPAKTRVTINVKSIATDPNYWENPHEFRPERFSNSDIDFRGQNFELIPFGVGRRGCPGMNFAVSLLELALANLLYRFDWELPPGMAAEDLDMEEAFGLSMHKKTPLCLVATPAIL